MIYEITVSTVTSWDSFISTYIRKWLGLHKNISNISLYSKNSPCLLPINSLSSVYKSIKENAFLQLRDSKDPIIASIPPSLNCGSAWSVKYEVENAEQRIQFNRILGYTQSDRSGLGMRTLRNIPEKATKEYRKSVGELSKKQDDEEAFAKAVQMSLQGQWTKWQNYIANDLSWKTIWAMPPNLLSFCIGSTYNTLASPSNELRWGLSVDSSCKLCNKTNCTISHILSGCYFSPQEGRYGYRHDNVLKVLVDNITTFLSKKPPSIPKKINKVEFVREGTLVKRKTAKPHKGIFHLSNDWVMNSDLDGNLQFPEFIAITALRPDIVIYSQKIKTIIIIELTCPSEENIEERHDGKTNKYSDLVEL